MIPMLEYFQETWSAMELASKISEIALAIGSGLDNLKK
jgi:hypothetical protein